MNQDSPHLGKTTTEADSQLAPGSGTGKPPPSGELSAASESTTRIAGFALDGTAQKTPVEPQLSQPSPTSLYSPPPSATRSSLLHPVISTEGKLEYLPEGQILGKCRIERLIGQGGMGAVYLAHHLALDVPVAVKVIIPRLDKDMAERVKRFFREARLASRIHHPNIVQMLDVGTDEETGVDYIVQEYVGGGTISDMMKKGRIEEARALDIIIGVASALVAAAEFNIVHRDIKPENIMLTTRGEVKLADLGIAKEGNDQDGGLTVSQVMMGTPSYVAPEQARNTKRVDARADIYSLGATLYHMLCGQPPYTGETTFEVLSNLIAEPVPNPRLKRPDLSPAVVALIMRMMAKDPAQRPDSAAMLLEELKLARNAIASSSGMGLRLSRWQWLAAGLGIVVLGGCLWLGLQERNGPKPGPVQANVPPSSVPAPPRQSSPLMPYGPLPTARQLKWSEMELLAVVHFNMNTFMDKDNCFGDEKESMFNPTDFDAEQIVLAAKAGGMKGLILTVKHLDGFCLWPSQYTEHSVKNSPWKEGKGDMVKEFSDACQKHGIKFGVFLSPADRNHAGYAQPSYHLYYKNQIRELLTGYGPIFQISFVDFAGGDGYYGGQGGRRSVGYWSYYDWNRIDALVHEVQPNCMAIGVQYRDGDRMIYGDGRWSGSSAGDVGDPCWSTIDGSKTNLSSDDRKHGCRTGAAWCGAATCVSLRPNWFYRASQDNQVMQPERLMNVYLFSVGRGANLIVNLSPDRRGRLHDIDVKSLQWFGQLLADTFGTDLAKTAKVSVSNIRGQDKRFGPESLIDGNPETYWATDDGIIPAEAILEFEAPITFTTIRLREYLPLGQRIDDWALDVWNNEKWEQIAEGSAIGACRLVRGTPHTTAKVRLRITKAAACPALTEFGLFFQPFNPNPPKLSR